MLLMTKGNLGTAFPQTKAADPRPQDNVALQEHEPKIARQEWTTFMEAEFDRMYTAGNRKLDVHQLTQSKLRPSPSLSAGK